MARLKKRQPAALTTPLMKLRYLGIMSWKSSVMKTLRTNSWEKRTKLGTVNNSKLQHNNVFFSPFKGYQNYLDEVILLGPILVEKTSGCSCRDEEDGLEGDLAFSSEVNV